jgi:hypothetical protein
MIDPREKEEEEKLRALGLEPSGGIPKAPEEIIVKYSFEATEIKEVRETFIKYQGELHPAVVATFKISQEVIQETPPLLCTWDEFHSKIYEQYNKKSLKAK